MMTNANGHAPASALGASRAATIRAARQAVNANREQVFPLVATGGEALVRRFDLMDLIALEAIPAQLQNAVNAMLEANMNGGTGSAPSQADFVQAAGGALTALRQTQALADVACLVGFLDPRLVPTPADVTDPEHELALEDIERSDRMAYLEWCQGTDAAAALAPAFPEPESAPAPRPAGEPLRDESVDLPLRAAPGPRP